jgi:ribonuclease PH
MDMKALGERQIRIDCDVLQADGGTRTASITGGFIALRLALSHLHNKEIIKSIPLTDQVAAISCGIYQGTAVLDLDYDEDSNAEVDANFVLTGNGTIVEIQATAEEKAFQKTQFNELLTLAENGIRNLISLQKNSLGL